MENLEAKLDRNWEMYRDVVKVIQAIHVQPSPETLAAIKRLSEQNEKITQILEKIVNTLK